ncbi:MAG: hypothetical protein LBO70_03065 [Clostridiales Family XIII bacterium]|jgi:hypothetical protein|nr:hypothetical protein [Clostridiales Family XIII bacterium]
MSKRKTRYSYLFFSLDIILLALFGLLCNTGPTGVLFHEVAGLVYAALIVVHLIFNRKWIVAAAKGKLRGRRSVAMLAVNILLFADLIVILETGTHVSQYLFPEDVKAESIVLVVHAACSVVAAILIVANVLLHAKAITKGRMLPKVGLVVVLTVIISYAMFGGIQGALDHGMPKDGDVKGQNGQSIDDSDHRLKDGEKK